jgi:hypothetical protein
MYRSFCSWYGVELTCLCLTYIMTATPNRYWRGTVSLLVVISVVWWWCCWKTGMSAFGASPFYLLLYHAIGLAVLGIKARSLSSSGGCHITTTDMHVNRVGRRQEGGRGEYTVLVRSTGQRKPVRLLPPRALFPPSIVFCFFVQPCYWYSEVLKAIFTSFETGLSLSAFGFPHCGRGFKYTSFGNQVYFVLFSWCFQFCWYFPYCLLRR